MGVQGFPTLKIVRPGKKPGKPTVEDYQGPRDAKAIISAVKERIPNVVKRVTDKGLEDWLKEGNETAKAVLFSDKGVTSATVRALAIDFAGIVTIAQIRNKEKEAMSTFGIEKVPALVLLPGGDTEGVVYDGKFEKAPMSAFLSQIAPPNPDCPLEKVSKKSSNSSKKDSKKEAKKSSSFSSASSSQHSADSESAKASATNIVLEEPELPVESSDPNIVDEKTPPPVVVEDISASIPRISSGADLQAQCFSPKSKQCILALLPPGAELPEAAITALASLAAIHKKHEDLNTHLFPFFEVPASNPFAATIREGLGLSAEDTQLITTMAKRGWWKTYSKTDFGAVAVEDWVDALRMGEGKKEKLPESLIGEAKVAEEKKEEEQHPIQIEIEEIVDEPVIEHVEL
jgi:protein disulfide-isomerase A6